MKVGVVFFLFTSLNLFFFGSSPSFANEDAWENASSVTRSQITLIYRDGQKYVWHTDRDHRSRVKIERAIDNYFEGNSPCFLGVKYCDEFLSVTNNHNSLKRSTRVTFDLEGLAIAMIQDINYDRYRDSGETCMKTLANGKSKLHADVPTQIRLNIPSSLNSSVSNHEFLRFVGARRASSGSDINPNVSTLQGEWIRYKSDPTFKPRLKWKINSHCLFSGTTLYISDYDLYDSISYQFPKDSINFDDADLLEDPIEKPVPE